MEVLIVSWPLALIILAVIFKKQLVRFINTISTFLSKQKGKDVEVELPDGKGKVKIAESKPLSKTDFDSIKSDYQNALIELGKHKAENSELLDYALSLIDELADARNAALFERILRFVKNWQLFFLAEGLTNREISLHITLNKLRVKYPDFDEVVSGEDVNQTLTELATIEVISIDGDKITFLERYYKFASYIGWVQ